jgi:hypothetical protein
MKATTEQLFNFWISYNVEGSNHTKTVTTKQPSEQAAKQDVLDYYGNEVTVTFLEIVNNGEA